MKVPKKSAIYFIKDLESVNLAGYNAYDELLTKFQNLNLVILGINLLPHPDMFMVRARKLEHDYDYLENVSDHSYNPNTRYITCGRANKKNQTIFYASRDILGATLELKPFEDMKVGDKVTFAFSRWKSTKEVKFITIFNPRDLNLIAKSEMREYVQFFQTTYETQIEKGNTDFLRFYEYISNKFREDINYDNQNRYKLTAAFSNYLYQNFPEYGGIIFQSVPAKDRYNFAIKREFIDDKSFVPTMFVKATYIKTNEKEINQDSYIECTGFNEQTGEMYWW